MFDINAGLTVAGVITATSFSGTVTTATNVTVADESSDTTCFPVFVTAATGDLAPKSGTNLTFNSSTGTLETTNVTVTGDLTVQGTTTTLDTDLIGVDKVEVGANNSTVGLAVTNLVLVQSLLLMMAHLKYSELTMVAILALELIILDKNYTLMDLAQLGYRSLADLLLLRV